MKFDRDPRVEGGGKWGQWLIIAIRFTALVLDSSRSNRISLDYSISFDFLRTCRPSKEYWTDDNNSSGELYRRWKKNWNFRLWNIYIYIYIEIISRFGKEMLINGL